MQKKAWTIFQIHGIGGVESGWQPISVETFDSTLDYIQAQKAKGLWVAPFVDVAAYLRAQYAFEHAKLAPDAHGTSFSWEVPPSFPNGVTLRVTASGNVALYQKGVKLEPENGIYNVSFDARMLTLVNE
jgi:hypothetical protein